ncbi:MAG: hypothetical protein JW940_06945 [Polyangiaceae bacterium]|nr:hypothetical protein [Polyangiaceae bacterium]
MSGKAYTSEERSVLLNGLASIPVDADADDSVLQTFLPGPQHQRALDHRVLVVRGERGAGKTALFHLLHAVARKGIRLSEVVSGAPDGQRVDGFVEQGTDHPPADVVEQFAAEAEQEELRAFWLGHLVGRLRADGITAAAFPEPFGPMYQAVPTSPAAWVPQARACLPALYAWMDALERQRDAPCFVVYDHLDRIGVTDRNVREKVSVGLLGLWLSLSQRYERIRGKVLLREDLFQAALTSFADATKLEARSVRLDWNAGRLFALLVRRMASNDPLRAWLKDVAQIELSKKKHLGWMPQPEFDDRGQRAFGKALVGPYMGAGPTKGFSHTWLINHLQDAHQHVTPRSLLVLVSGAATLALDRGPRAGYRRLLAPPELQQSLEKASLRRVAEISEDYPVVRRLEGLRGKTLFFSRGEVVRALRAQPLDDGFDSDPERAFDELIRIGVLADRRGRIDVPDVYRSGFGILRKGGTRRVG